MAIRTSAAIRIGSTSRVGSEVLGMSEEPLLSLRMLALLLSTVKVVLTSTAPEG